MSVKIGDWFVLYQMSKNLNRKFFYDFLIALAKEYHCNKQMKYKQISNAETNLESGNLLDEPDLAKSHEKSAENLEAEELKKSKTLDEPPPLMEGSPRTLKKVHTA